MQHVSGKGVQIPMNHSKARILPQLFQLLLQGQVSPDEKTFLMYSPETCTEEDPLLCV